MAHGGFPGLQVILNQVSVSSAKTSWSCRDGQGTSLRHSKSPRAVTKGMMDKEKGLPRPGAAALGHRIPWEQVGLPGAAGLRDKRGGKGAPL